ncbi:hypothetical protein K493DRAFT_336264 [Basidiobolus meristosporus CBS 931.73]|uniref:RED-like N-terminal domain-containing protein n=1 Tax=Basidiobolus meristosporus CBS 931.73 TaxID=1314790 RepID=A0A1Y1YJX7_9FUNG|nr:hypothetical protein K493DRAFT_336264 [Basidiobolus meristosporus CBS 931.73]|eukprot:ORX98153.1 hypothetical protein K493DRAFT_336264 [Basidiobolus meristosporus CBS 931.73]
MSNPTAPAGFVAPAEINKKGLSQDDFRKLLATPRPGGSNNSELQATPRGGGSFSKPFPKRTVPGTPRLSTNPDAPIFTKSKKKWQPANDEDSEKYRDRARERRRGENPDYVETERILATLQTPEDPNLAYEKSKYLGGDAEHTHLVKGLDYALLEKVRREKMANETSEKVDSELEKLLASIRDEAAPLKFVTKFGEAIYNSAMAKPEYPKVNEFMIPGRMAYVFELEEEGEYRDPFYIPTTAIRSIADLPSAGVDKEKVVTNNIIIEKIGQVFAYARDGNRGLTNSDGKKLKKKAKQEAKVEPAVQVDNDDDDIFEGIGREYVMEVDEDSRKQQPTPAAKPSYFDDAEDMFSEMANEEEDKQARMASMKAIIDKAGAAPPQVGTDDDHPDKALPKTEAKQDAYEGDYSTFGLGGEANSNTLDYAFDSEHSASDDEATIEELRTKRGQLSRWDVDSDDEKKRPAKKKAKGNQKLDRELQMVNRIMEDKYGEASK